MLSLIALSLCLPALPSGPLQVADVQAIRAGKIHTLGPAGTLENGTLLIQGGKVTAVGGPDMALPPGTVVVDFGSGAEIVPGFVAADSSLTDGAPSPRTAAPGLLATDSFDGYRPYLGALAAGVTSAYITPARGRLIAGQGAMVKLAGDDPQARVLRAPAAIHGAISAEARNTPGYWEPPVPATADVGLGRPQEQLPHSAAGALLALGQLLDGVANGQELPGFGPRAVRELTPLVKAKVPWLLGAVEGYEIGALLDFAEQRKLPLVIEGAHFAGAYAERLAELGVGVIYQLPFDANRGGLDRGKDPEQPWPDLDVPAKLAAAGVRLAVTPGADSGVRDLRFAAMVLARKGLTPERALASITRVPAELLGVADRVGSLQNGRDADFVVFNGAPMNSGSTVVATYVDGHSVWTPAMPFADEDARNAILIQGYDPRSAPLVLSVAELHLGDGRVLTPGEVLVQDGRIAEVGARVSRPAGVTVVSGSAAMPGIIDALGYLGLGDSGRVPGLDFDLTKVLEPGDLIDRRVARYGVTTVAMNFRGSSSNGTPVVAYHPAAERPSDLTVDALAAVRIPWGDDNVYEAGKGVRDLLNRALAYDKSWREYEQKLAEWTPEAPRPDFRLPPEEEADAKAAEGEKAAEEGEGEGDKAEDKKKKKSKDVDPDPVTGIWTADLTVGEGLTKAVRMQIRLGEAIEAPVVAVVASEKAAEAAEKPAEEQADEKADEKDEKKEEGKQEKPEEPKEKKDKKDKKDADKPTGPDRKVEGWLRSELLSDRLLAVSGVYHADGGLVLEGVGQEGAFRVDGKLDDITVDAEAVHYAAKVAYRGLEVELAATRQSRDYPEAKRPVRGEAEAKADAPEPKGKPKEPRRDARLDPLRRVLTGQAAMLIDVDRAPEILACVDACAQAGVKPVLVGANEVLGVAEQVRGRVLGVLPTDLVVLGTSDGSRLSRNRYAELQAAGLPVAFHSDAEEGAADLYLIASYAISNGMSPTGALKALTGDAARLLCIDDQVGLLESGRFGDLILFDKSPLEPSARIQRVWVAGREVR